MSRIIMMVLLVMGLTLGMAACQQSATDGDGGNGGDTEPADQGGDTMPEGTEDKMEEMEEQADDTGQMHEGTEHKHEGTESK